MKLNCLCSRGPHWPARALGWGFSGWIASCSLGACLIILPTSLTCAAAASASDFTNRLVQTRAKAPRGFSVLAQPPFVVVGDEPEIQVRRHATRTVQWAVDLLKKDYFARDPDSTIAIWLFKDKASYDRYTRELFQDHPSTPFGYYSPAHQALIMNISTGGGTLVHEIVHPFMRANFPECPAWFNEGLGSLFEQSGERNGHIVGFPNWRLPALQEAIRHGGIPSFPKMMAMSDAEFYGRDAGARYNQHYAQARYLCLYLQEQGLLTEFYRQFVANAKKDPSGVNTLKKVLHTEDLDAFQKKWERFVLALSFP